MIKIKKNKELFLAPIITLCILLVVYIVKGVYPFGNGSISYYDMNQNYIQLYTRVHDFLHGKTSLIYDWYTGSSSRTYSSIPSYMLNPINWILYFVPRDRIYYSMTWFLTLKMMAMSVTMVLYMKKVRDLDPVYTTIIAVLYVFCGYVLQYYSNIFFLDSALLMPLIMLGLKDLLRNNKGGVYTVFLTINLIIETYLSIMVLFFIVFYCLAYLFFFEKRENRPRITARLGICTIIALLISMALIYPEIIQWSATPRLKGYSNGYIDIINKNPICDIDQKFFMLFGSEFTLSALITAIIKTKTDKQKLSRETWFYIALIILMCIPIVIESVNLLWHMGSYIAFPFRFAFILTFVTLEYLAFFLEKQTDTPYFGINSEDGNKVTIIIVLITVIAFVFLVLTSSYFTTYGILQGTYYDCFYSSALMFIFAGTLVFSLKNKMFRKYYFLIITILHSALAGWGFIAPKEVYAPDPETAGTYSPQTIIDSTMLDQQMNFQNDNLSRVKLVHSVLSTNYSLIMERPAISQWINESSYEYFIQMKKLGYSQNYTRTVDTGGTIFSDALLNIKKAISTDYLDSRLYTPEQEIAEYKVYDCNYKLPFGILTDERVLNTDFEENGMTLHNLLFSTFSTTDTPLINIIDLKEYMISHDKTEYESVAFEGERLFELSAETDSVLYVYQDPEYFIDNKKRFSVNGQEIIFPLFDDREYMDYPTDFNNGIFALGSFEPGTIDLIIGTGGFAPFAGLEIGLLDINAFTELTDYYSTRCVSDVKAEGTSITMTADVQDNQYLFLPIEYDKNWRAEVNGEAAEVYPVLNKSFIAVKLTEGHCDIRMKYIPDEIIKMIPVSAAGLLLAVLLLILRRKGHDPAEVSIINKTAYVCFIILSAGMLLILNVIPVAAAILNLIIRN